MNQSMKIGADGLVGTTAIVTGASRGFGRAIAAALSEAGFTPAVADAADPSTARRLVDEHRPRTLVLCAGATPRMSPLQNQTWESFSEAAYAERQGVDVGTFVRSSGPALSAEQVARSVLDIAGGDAGDPGAYLLTASGLSLVA